MCSPVARDETGTNGSNWSLLRTFCSGQSDADYHGSNGQADTHSLHSSHLSVQEDPLLIRSHKQQTTQQVRSVSSFTNDLICRLQRFLPLLLTIVPFEASCYIVVLGTRGTFYACCHYCCRYYSQSYSEFLLIFEIFVLVVFEIRNCRVHLGFSAFVGNWENCKICKMSNAETYVVMYSNF